MPDVHDSNQWVNSDARSAMFRFASLHIQPSEEAEDAVQDTLLVLMERPQLIDNVQDVRISRVVYS